MTVSGIKQDSKYIHSLCAMFYGQPCIRNLLQVRNISFSSLHLTQANQAITHM